jgi:hypothetical protein
MYSLHVDVSDPEDGGKIKLRINIPHVHRRKSYFILHNIYIQFVPHSKHIHLRCVARNCHRGGLHSST